MNGNYDLNEVAMMTGFSTRTLRNYLKQGLLRGEKADGAWRFSAEDLDRFFSEPFVKEGLRIKRGSIVLDFLAVRHSDKPRACVILDLPSTPAEGRSASLFFCERMKDAHDVVFTFDRDGGVSRAILSGAKDQVLKIVNAYESRS